MKKYLWLLLGLLLLTACTKNELVEPYLNVSEMNLTLKVDEEVTLTVVSNIDYEYVIENPTIISIDSDVVRGEKAGSTKITVKAGKLQKEILVTVESVTTETKPEITLLSVYDVIELAIDPYYTPRYKLIGSNVEVTISAVEGTLVLEGRILFSKEGIYTFTITASNQMGSDSKTFTVEVIESKSEPKLLIHEKEEVVFLTNPTYTLDYSVIEGYPNSEVIITGSPSTYQLDGDTITFEAAGEYTLTVTATNSEGSDRGLIHVYVYESSIITHETFDVTPSSYLVDSTQNGSVNFTNSTMEIITSASGDKAFVTVPLTKLKDQIYVKTRFSVSTTSFSNALFFYNDDSEIVVSLAFQNNHIHYHDGSAWKQIIGYEINVFYDIEMVLDMNEGVFDLYIDSQKIGQYSFRNPIKRDTITKMVIGSDKINTKMIYEDLLVMYGSRP